MWRSAFFQRRRNKPIQRWPMLESPSWLHHRQHRDRCSVRCARDMISWPCRSSRMHLSGSRNADELQNLISRTTTAALVLHPVGMTVIIHYHNDDQIHRPAAAGLTFLTLLISLFMLHRGSNGTSRLPSFITLSIGSLAAFVTTVVFLIDVILVAVIRKRVRNATDGDLDLVWGNAVRSLLFLK